MKIKFIFLSVVCLFILSGCSAVKEIGGAYNMTQCKYSYNSISALTLDGMDLSKGVSVSNIAKIATLLSGKSSSIPLNFTLNMNVLNPNQTEAMLNGLQYIISVDDVEFTTGQVNQSLNIPSGGTKILPLTIGVDLASLMKDNSKGAVENIAKNFIGIGTEKSNVKVQLKPSFKIGGQVITSPSYIPVSFSFGGK